MILDFNHFNRMGMPKEKAPSLYQYSHPMNQMPNRSCDIYLLQNNVSITSVGNLDHKLLVKYDMKSKSLTDPTTKEIVDWKDAHLKNTSEKPHCWIYKDDLVYKLKYNGR